MSGARDAAASLRPLGDRTVTRLDEILRQQRLVLETAGAIAASPDLGGILRALVAGVRALAGGESGSVRLRTSDPEAAAVVYRVYRWRGDQWHEEEERHEGLGGDMARLAGGASGEYLPDLAAGDDAAARAYRRFGARSSLKVALRAGGRVIGVLHADADRAHAFGAELLVPLQVLADHAGSAAEQARLRMEAAERLALLVVAERVSAAAHAAGGLDDLLRRLLEESVAATGACRGTIALVDEDRRFVRGCVGLNQPPGMVEATVRRLYSEPAPDEDIYAIAVRSGEQMVVDDHHPALHRPTFRRFAAVLRAQQRVLTPIRYAGAVIGVLSLVWDNGEVPGAESRRMLRLIAEQAGGAIARSRLQAAEQARSAAHAAALERQYQEAESARRESRAILDAAGEGMVLLSLEGRVIDVNRRFSDLFALEPDAILGLRLGDLQDDLDRIFGDPSVAARLAAELGRDSGETVLELRQQWPEPRELQGYSTAVRSAEQAVLGRLYAFRDVTKERAAERMKTEFVSLVSHELRTPLTSIKGYIDLLASGDVGPLTTDQLEFLGIARNNADRLVALINDLLDLSRIEAGRMELHRKPLDLVPLLQQVARSLRPQLEAKPLSLALELPAALPVAGDADRLVQVFTNLLSNAIKYTPAGGAVAIRATMRAGEVDVAVTDTGIGLTPAEQERLFTKFFRSSHRVAREAGGTGLGLAITRSLVELHGGSIHVRSVPGEGSTFLVHLLVSERPIRPQDTPDARPVPSFSGGRILVVDDEPDIAQLIRRYLEHGGYQVAVALSGAEAWRLVREQRPDLITLDIKLPDVDGFTVLEWLKNDPTTATIPVVFLSIVSAEGEGLRLGAIDYLTKPVQEEVLLARVTRALTDRRSQLIVVADDDAATRRLIAGQLRKAGYDVLEAANGQEAVRLARERHPDLLLLDVKMPGVDGLAALRALREDNATHELSVVMMTACPGELEEHRAAIEALGALALASKPCTMAELAEVLAGRLEGGRRP